MCSAVRQDETQAGGHVEEKIKMFSSVWQNQTQAGGRVEEARLIIVASAVEDTGYKHVTLHVKCLSKQPCQRRVFTMLLLWFDSCQRGRLVLRFEAGCFCMDVSAMIFNSCSLELQLTQSCLFFLALQLPSFLTHFSGMFFRSDFSAVSYA